MAYSGIVSETSARFIYDDYDEYLREVKIGIKNLEGTSRIVVEQLDEGAVVPYRFEVSDFKNGYFTTIVDKEYFSEFRIIAYNQNGHTISDTFVLDALEPWDGEMQMTITDNTIKILPIGTRRSIKNISYRISLISKDARSVGNVLQGDLSSDETIDVSNLTPGMYIVECKTESGKKTSRKFIKQ